MNQKRFGLCFLLSLGLTGLIFSGSAQGARSLDGRKPVLQENNRDAERLLAAEVTADSPPKKRLGKINSLSQWGARKLPTSYRRKYDKAFEKWSKAKEVYEQTKALMGPDLKSLSNYEGTEKRYLEFKNGVEQGAFQLECLKHHQMVEQAHKNKRVARTEWMEALDKAVAAFVGQGGDLAKYEKSFWKKAIEEAKKENEKLLAANAPKAKMFLSKQDLEEAHGIFSKLVKTRGDMKKLAKASKAIPQEMFDRFTKDISTFQQKYNENAQAYWGGLKTGYEIYNATLELVQKPEGVAKALQAKMIFSGKTKGKKLKFVVKAKANWCYATLGRWESISGSEDSDLKWKYGKSYSKVQEFRVRKKEQVPWGTASGFCTTKATKVTRKGTLKFSGSTNKLHYVVVGWPREKVPMFVAAHANAIMVDPCDPKGWYTLWTHPVPGTFAYSDNEPVLWTFRDDNHKEAFTAAGINGLSGLARMKSKAPEKRAFKKAEWVFRGCYPKGVGYDSQGIKYETCMRKITNQFIPKFNAANKARDKARTQQARKRAEKKLTSLRFAKSAKEKKKCGPTRNKITKRMNKVYSKIVDWHAKNEIKIDIDVMQYVQAQKEGKGRPE